MAEDKEDLIVEVEEKIYTNVAYVIGTLAKKYLPLIPDTNDLNQAMMNTMARLVGEMVACYPEEDQEDTFKVLTDLIHYHQMMMLTELRGARQVEEAEEPSEPEKLDLATMTPLGNC